jgi:hypothetical protein
MARAALIPQRCAVDGFILVAVDALLLCGHLPSDEIDPRVAIETGEFGVLA